MQTEQHSELAVRGRYGWSWYFGLKYNVDRSTTHPKLSPTGVQTHDLQIMNNPFHVPETLLF